MELPYELDIPLLGMYPDKTIVQKDTCTPVFTAALFTIAMTTTSSADECIKKTWYIYTMEYYKTIKTVK